MKKLLLILSFLTFNAYAWDSHKKIHCFGDWTEAHFEEIRTNGYFHSYLTVKYKDFSKTDSQPKVQNLRDGIFISSIYGLLSNTNESCTYRRELPSYGAKLTIKLDDRNTITSDVLCTCEYYRQSH